MTSLTMDLQDTVQDYNPYHESSDADMPQEASEQAMNGSKENDEVDKVNLANLLTDAPLKKKKKKKSKSQRGINKPTGFEPFFADAPLTPAQVAEEADIYSPTLSFNVRILTAIQRYELRRKLDPERRDMFYKWLVYGGVRVGPNMFQGLSVRDREGLDKDQITSNLAQTSLDEDQTSHDGPGAKYVVDFEGVMRAFLSHRIPHLYPLTPAFITKLTSTLLNFLNYLLHHNVCPEHAPSINSARHILHLATTDLALLEPAQSWLPGDFNTSCAILFGLVPARSDEPWDDNDLDPNTQQQQEKEDDPNSPRRPGSITLPLAAQIARVGLACTASDALFDAWSRLLEPHLSLSPSPNPTPHLPTTHLTTSLLGLEILTLNPPSSTTRTFYRERTPNHFRAPGTLTAKPWFGHPGEPVYDLTDDELEGVGKERERRRREERWTLVLEEQAMGWLRVGGRVLGRVGWWDGGKGGSGEGSMGGEGEGERVGLAFWVDVVGVWPAWEGGADVNDLVVQGREMGWKEGGDSVEGGNGSLAGDFEEEYEGIAAEGQRQGANVNKEVVGEVEAEAVAQAEAGAGANGAAEGDGNGEGEGK